MFVSARTRIFVSVGHNHASPKNKREREIKDNYKWRHALLLNIRKLWRDCVTALHLIGIDSARWYRCRIYSRVFRNNLLAFANNHNFSDLVARPENRKSLYYLEGRDATLSRHSLERERERGAVSSYCFKARKFAPLTRALDATLGVARTRERVHFSTRPRDILLWCGYIRSRVRFSNSSVISPTPHGNWHRMCQLIVLNVNSYDGDYVIIARNSENLPSKKWVCENYREDTGI